MQTVKVVIRRFILRRCFAQSIWIVVCLVSLFGSEASSKSSSTLLLQSVEENNKYLNAFEADNVVWRSCLELNFEGIENPISEVKLFADTLINGVNWKIFKREESIGLVRTEDRKVIFMPHPEYDHFEPVYNGVETVLYDFSLEIGDVLKPWGSVISIDSVDLNDGKKHKRIKIGLSNHIEGLGNDFSDPFFILFPAFYYAEPFYSNVLPRQW